MSSFWGSTGGGSGGSSIGGVITGGTDKAILFVSPAGIVAEDPTGLYYDQATNTFTVAGPAASRTLTLTDAGNASYFQSAQGTSAAVSPINTGRIIYNATTQKWQASENNGAYTNLVPVSVALDDLTDVSLSTPTTDQVLRYNGSEWVNGVAGNTSAGASSVFFNDDTSIVGTGTNNTLGINTLSKTPVVGIETVDTVTVNSNTLPIEAYLYDTALGITSIPAGVWEFDTYAGVDAAGGVSEILRNVYKVVPEQGGVTMTTTGSGTSRTATASGGTPFAAAKVSVGGTVDSDSYLQTPQGLYRITARTSDTEVTIATPTTYANEAGAAFSVWLRLFQTTTGEINNISPAYALFNGITVQAAFTVTATDKLGSIVFGKTTSGTNKIISFVHNGTTHYSHFHSPLAVVHNDLAGLQGGTAAEFYHLSAANYTVARTKSVEIICVDFTVDLTVGDGKGYFTIPTALNGMNLVAVSAQVITAGTTGTTDIQIHNVTQGVDMLTTKITIDSGETSSSTAATPPVIDAANDDVASYDLIRVDADAVSTTPPKSLIVNCEFRLP